MFGLYTRKQIDVEIDEAIRSTKEDSLEYVKIKDIEIANLNDVIETLQHTKETKENSNTKLIVRLDEVLSELDELKKKYADVYSDREEIIKENEFLTKMRKELEDELKTCYTQEAMRE